MPSGQPWPLVSIVTPSYNQGQFVEETIRSVLLQGYPQLEYVVIDGGSTDGSVEIIARYAPWLAYWVSEPDAGQAQAINKGLARAQGNVLAWLNSDDLYEPGAVAAAVQSLDPRKGPYIAFGDCLFVDEQGQPMHLYRGVDRPFADKLCYWRGWSIPQPTVFFARQVLEQTGGLDESLRLALDYDLFLRFAYHYRFTHAGKVLARYRRHTAAKSGTAWKGTRARFYQEMKPISQRYWPQLSTKDLWRVRAGYAWHRLATRTGLDTIRYELGTLKRGLA
jgi:glycosyltransferase involved in cell wall biosynthesis